MSAEAALLARHLAIPPSLRPLLLLLGIAAAVAAGVVVVLWSQEPNYSLLFGKLSPQDAAQIAQALESSGVPYKLDSLTGAITVPSQQVHDARLKLAGQGLPENDGGFAVLSKNPGLGVSQFMEGARYQHALEMELARTIANLQAIEAARVHLAMPRQSAFIRDRRSPSASVFLQMKLGRRLEPQQVTAIVNLVASSIPDLDARHVTVIDQQGRLLSAPGGDDELAARDQQLELARAMEERYTQRVEQLLEPLIGPGRVRAQVVADVELSTTEEAREQYRPESQIVRSEQSSEESSRNGGAPQGVPGALSNQPPLAGTALAPGASAGAAQAVAAQEVLPGVPAPPDNVSRQATRNYEIDRTLAYTRQPAGRLKRLTVAVLVDNQRIVAADGTSSETPLSEEQLDNMTRLVKDAVGFDASRGDSVNVVNAPFRGEPEMQPLDIDAAPLWENPLIRDIAKLLVGLIVLIVLVLAVLRPLVRSLLNPPRPAHVPVPLPSTVGAESQGDGETRRNSIGYEERIEQAKALVSQDPARVAQVVKAWVGKDE